MAKIGLWSLSGSSGEVAGSGDGVFDGSGGYVEIPSDPAFGLATGAIALRFTQNSASTGDVPYGSYPAQTLFSVDSKDFDDGGHLTIFVTSAGTVSVRHQNATDDFFYSGGNVTLGQPTTVIYS